MTGGRARITAHPAMVRIAWTPGWHAKIVERVVLPLGLNEERQRLALQALLDRDRVRDRIAAAFRPPVGASRWTDGSHGAFYAARESVTAFYEKLHHDATLLRSFRIGPHLHTLELLRVDIKATLEDIRSMMRRNAAWRHPTDYAACQTHARQRVSTGAAGLLYASLRDPEGTCAVLFRREAIRRVVVHKSVAVEWDGAQFLVPAGAP